MAVAGLLWRGVTITAPSGLVAGIEAAVALVAAGLVSVGVRYLSESNLRNLDAEAKRVGSRWISSFISPAHAATFSDKASASVRLTIDLVTARQERALKASTGFWQL